MLSCEASFNELSHAKTVFLIAHSTSAASTSTSLYTLVPVSCCGIDTYSFTDPVQIRIGDATECRTDNWTNAEKDTHQEQMVNPPLLNPPSCLTALHEMKVSSET